MRLITGQLVDEGVPTSRPGKPWHPSHVHRVLANAAYTGVWWYGQNRRVSTEDGFRVYEQPRDTWIAIPVPPLVDEQTWERAQALKKERLVKAKRNTKLFYLLQHLVRCAECGLRFGAESSWSNITMRDGKRHRYEAGRPSPLLLLLRHEGAPPPLQEASLYQG